MTYQSLLEMKTANSKGDLIKRIVNKESKQKSGRLEEDHKKAKRLENGIRNVEGIQIENIVETNIVLVNVEKTKYDAESFIVQLKEKGILAVSFGPNTVWFVTHYDVTAKEMDSVIDSIKEIFS
jgi:threonine aldolase